MRQNLLKQSLRKHWSRMLKNGFNSMANIVKAINGELEIQHLSSSETKAKVRVQEVKKGPGFSAVAGMQQFKDTIQKDVIDALNDKESYAEYGLTIPSGMLLHGPPGCGKTFFAERLAEEIGFNFLQLKPSDIQSKHVNELQKKIKKLFDEARENAPSIIFLDDLHTIVPDTSHMQEARMFILAADELLAQTNCGDDGVFVIGATSQPYFIEPGILREGLFDKVIYLPPPDKEARESMFRIYLDKRPKREVGLDYSELAAATENYFSRDIEFLCNEAARKALRRNARISKEIVLEVIDENKPPESIEELNRYKAIKAEMYVSFDKPDDRPFILFEKRLSIDSH